MHALSEVSFNNSTKKTKKMKDHREELTANTIIIVLSFLILGLLYLIKK